MLNRNVTPRESPAIEPPKNLDLEKKLQNIRSIRKSRLEKTEMEYQQTQRQLEQANQDYNDAVMNITVSEMAYLDEKKILEQRLLGQKYNSAILHAWMKTESILTSAITQAEKHALEKHKEIEMREEDVKQAKLKYRKHMIAVEKLDILKKEMDKEQA